MVLQMPKEVPSAMLKERLMKQTNWLENAKKRNFVKLFIETAYIVLVFERWFQRRPFFFFPVIYN